MPFRDNAGIPKDQDVPASAARREDGRDGAGPCLPASFSRLNLGTQQPTPTGARDLTERLNDCTVPKV